MYKKIFMGIAAVAALTLVSCSSDDLNSLSDNSSKNEAISFDGYLGRSAVSVNGSRASELKIDGLKEATGGFGVFGNYKNADDREFGSNLFDNVKVFWSSSSEPAKWTYEHTKYWPTEGHIDFLAYAPYEEGKKLNNTSIDFTVDGDVAKQKDLLWATAENQTKAKNSGENKVKFTFKHALAKIGYTVKTSEHDAGTTIKLNKITLAGSATEPTKTAFYPKGTINLSTGAWTPSTSEEKLNFEWFTNTSGKEVTTEATGNEPDNYLFVIPQKFSAAPATDELYVIVEYTIQTGTTDMKSRVSSKITKEFEQGKAYTINLSLGLTPIEFDVEVVNGWIPATDDININTWN